MVDPSEIAAQINAVMGKNSVIMGSDAELNVGYLPTSIMPIDHLLGGGLPRGRFTEVYGDYSTLKSYLAIKALATAQKAGLSTLLVDSEHAYDPEWFAAVGGDPTGLVIMRPETGEEAIGAMEVGIRNGIDLIVWDSIATSQPRAEAKTSPTENAQPARLAAMMSQGLRRLNTANKSTAVLCLNQTRTNVGVVFGSNEAIPGGKAMPFYASYRLSLRKAGKITEPLKVWNGQKLDDGKQTTGIKIKATLEKSKLSSPNREVWMIFDYRNGTIDELGWVLGMGLEKGLLEKTGNGRWKWANDEGKAMTEAILRSSITNEEIEEIIND